LAKSSQDSVTSHNLSQNLMRADLQHAITAVTFAAAFRLKEKNHG
jgi:hypothetical protein